MNTHRICLASLIVLGVLCAVAAEGQQRIGVGLEFDSSETFDIEAGESIPFRISIRNEQNELVTNWDRIGRDVILMLRGTNAETDSSRSSWSADADAYSWTRIHLDGNPLAMDSTAEEAGVSIQYYSIPRTAFPTGQVSLTFSHSRADSGMVLEIAPSSSFLQHRLPPITVQPGTHENYLVDLTSAIPDSDAVFLLRLYEILVTPRDRFLNLVTDRAIPSECTARFPGEFDNLPGTTAGLPGPVEITGPTAMYLASRIHRGQPIDTTLQHPPELQWVRIFSAADTAVAGRSDPYAVLDHAPYPVTLIDPPDMAYLDLYPVDAVLFSWQNPVPDDPYHGIIVSRFDSTTIHSDDVLREIKFLDEETLTRQIQFDVDSNGYGSTWNAPPTYLYQIIDQLAGLPPYKIYTMVWFVESSDGLYSTGSRSSVNPSEAPGHRLTVEKNIDIHVPRPPVALYGTLRQNYPNPFRQESMIPVEMRSAANVRVLVYNLLGERVMCLYAGMLSPGTHRFRFDGAGLPPGVYRCVLETNGTTMSRSMLLLR